MKIILLVLALTFSGCALTKEADVEVWGIYMVNQLTGLVGIGYTHYNRKAYENKKETQCLPSK